MTVVNEMLYLCIMNDVLARFLLGVEEVLPEEGVSERLANGGLKVKFGADPSAADLHVGHMVVLKKLRLLQDLGHTVQFLIGDFTALIGDPTGKSATRPTLSRDEVLANARTYQEQVFMILDEAKTEVVYNSEWLEKLGASGMLQLAGKSSVARMMERDDFSKRFKAGASIGIHEFLYPLLQGYDSVVLESDIEMGGTDQKFNLLMGRQLQKDAGVPEQVIITVPILEGLDGVQKMSKSLGNHIGLRDEANDMFGKVMSIPDTLILRYMTLVSDFSAGEIEDAKVAMDAGANPRDFKVKLGMDIVRQLHGAAAAEGAYGAFQKVFSQGDVPDDMPEISIEDGMSVLDAMILAEVVSSRKDGRRMIEQGAVSIDGEKVLDVGAAAAPGVVKVGKRRFFRVIRSV